MFYRRAPETWPLRSSPGAAARIRSIKEALEAAKFVLTEIARINDLSEDERMDRVRADHREGLALLTSHLDYPFFECGRRALGRTTDLTLYILATSADVAANAAHETVYSVFVKQFVEKFVKRGHATT